MTPYYTSQIPLQVSATGISGISVLRKTGSYLFKVSDHLDSPRVIL